MPVARAGDDGAMARTTAEWMPKSEEDYDEARRELTSRFAIGCGRRPRAGQGRRRGADPLQVGLSRRPPDPLDVATSVRSISGCTRPRWWPTTRTRRDLGGGQAFVRFLDESGLLAPDSEPAEVLVAHLEPARASSSTTWPTSRATAPASASGPAPWPKESASAIRLKSRPSWPGSTPARVRTRSRVGPRPRQRALPARRGGSPHRGRGPRAPQPSAASAGLKGGPFRAAGAVATAVEEGQGDQVLGLAEAEGHAVQDASLVFVLSINAFDRLWSMAASMPARFFLILRPSSTKASMRHRWAQPATRRGW